MDDRSHSGSSKSSGSAMKNKSSSSSSSSNKQFNGYQTIINSEIRQYGGQYLLQSSGGSKGSSSGVKAGRGNASLVVSEDLVRSNQLKRGIR